MTLRELAELSKKMREWQKRFFAGERTPEVVAVAKDYERKVDAAIRDILNPPPPTLFDPPPPDDEAPKPIPNPWDRH